jgi:MATE family multidrug resistance protein
LIPVVYRFFILVGHSPEQLELEYTYFRILMLGGIAVFLRKVLVGFFFGVGKSRVVMIADLVGMLVNIPINYVLIFGKFGFPRMEKKGAAIGAVVGSFTIVAILLFFFLRHEYYRGYHNLQL